MTFFVPQSTSTPLYPEVSAIGDDFPDVPIYQSSSANAKEEIFKRAGMLKGVYENNNGPVTNSALPQFTMTPDFVALQSALREDCVPDTVPETLFPAPSHDQAVKPLTLSICELTKKFTELEAEDTGKISQIYEGYKEMSFRVEIERSNVLKSSAIIFHPHINQLYDSKHKDLIQAVSEILDQIEGIDRGVDVRSKIVKELKLSPVAEYVLNTWYESNMNKAYPCPKTCSLLAQAGGIEQEKVFTWCEAQMGAQTK